MTLELHEHQFKGAFDDVLLADVIILLGIETVARHDIITLESDDGRKRTLKERHEQKKEQAPEPQGEPRARRGRK